MSSRRWWCSVVLVIVLGWFVDGAAELIECSPISHDDQVLYDRWGGQQQPPLEWVDCTGRCDRGLRLCRFRERPPSASDALVFATCNGRSVGPACRLVPES